MVLNPTYLMGPENEESGTATTIRNINRKTATQYLLILIFLTYEIKYNNYEKLQTNSRSRSPLKIPPPPPPWYILAV